MGGVEMAVSVEWASDDHRILLVIHEAVWTWEDMFQAYQEGLSMIRSVENPVHVIIDHSREADFPTNFAAVLPRFAAMPIPANVGLIIQVGTRGATRVGTELFSLMYRKLHLVDALEDAFALIKVHDERRTKARQES
jgi:hypothetical protein